MNRPKNTVKPAANPARTQTPMPRPTGQPAPPVTSAPQPPTLMPIAQPHPAPSTPTDSGVSPIMQGSLPPIAAGGDSYTRQFYGGANLPKRRFLPVGLVP